MHIRTDKKWKQFKYRDEVPKKVLASEFDWLDEDDIDGFFRHHGVWYHTSQFMRVPNDAEGLSGWDGYASDSFSAGTVIKLSSDGEEYIVGTYRT